MRGRLQMCLALACAVVGVQNTQAFVVAPTIICDRSALPGGSRAPQLRPLGCRAAVMRAADLSLFSPAKTNLFLRITRKREDGFHELASVFQTLGLGDTMDITKLEGATEDVLSCNVDEVPLDGKNLIVKGFDLFRQRTGKKDFFRCDIDKQTPLEGGMGGGSSNCATAMWAANKLCGEPATDKQLIEWGADLGSDVSFFLSLGTAYCTGRGEIIEQLPALPTPPGSFWVLKPPEGCPTGKVYGQLGLSPGQELPGPDPAELRDKLLAGGLSQDVCVNDLEPPAHAVVPVLADIKQALKRGGFHTVLLSGSGATTFCLSDEAGAHPRQALEAAGLWHDKIMVRGPIPFVSRSPDSWYQAP